jgi:solute carrier family 25 (mitochondrial uncoupling protein), member 8/9
MSSTKSKCSPVHDLFVSGTASGLANVLTNPFDVIKTRMQLNGKMIDSKPVASTGAMDFSSRSIKLPAGRTFQSPSPITHTASTIAHTEGMATLLQVAHPQLTYSLKPSVNIHMPRSGIISTGLGIIKNEGIGALYSGAGATVIRGFVQGGLRLGLYSPIKETLISFDSSAKQSGNLSIATKLMAGSLSGGFAACFSSPIDLIKTRQMAQGSAGNALGIVRSIISAEGVQGLWRGSGTAMARVSLLTAVQVASYDEVKKSIAAFKVPGLGEGQFSIQLLSSLVAGFAATTATNPIDVVKTCVMAAKKKGGMKLSTADAIREIVTKDGAAGFMKGWSASFSRMGPQTVFCLLINEQLRTLLGMKAM